MTDKACLLVTGSDEAAQLIQGQGVRERVHSLVASTDTPAAAAGGGTAALLHNTSLLDYAGFAMTAKPSVNLLVLLQVATLPYAQCKMQACQSFIESCAVTANLSISLMVFLLVCALSCPMHNVKGNTCLI